MAFVNSSVEHAKLGSRDYDSLDSQGLLQVAFFSYTHSGGADVGEVDLCRLPPGRVRVMIDLCRLVTSQFVSTSDLHLGHREYVEEDGTEKAEDNNLFADNLDAGGGALDQSFPLPTSGAPWHDLNSQEGIEIYAEIDTANIADADTIHGYVVYAIIA